MILFSLQGEHNSLNFFLLRQQLYSMMLLNCGVGEDSWESLGLQGDPTNPFWRSSALGVLWREWCWSWSSSTLATSCKELTHWKRLWCWEGLGAGREGNDRGWDGWMASPTRWTWVWVNSGSWWWTGKPGVLWFMGSQRVRHDWATELTWTEHNILCSILSSLRIQSRHLRMPLMLFWLPVFHLRLFSIDSKGAKNVAHFLFLDFGLCGRIWCFW